jgi:hypothetical protein
VLVNKASEDGKCLLSEDNVSRTLRLETLPVNQRVKVVNCNGVTGAGVDEGFSWLGKLFGDFNWYVMSI